VRVRGPVGRSRGRTGGGPKGRRSRVPGRVPGGGVPGPGGAVGTGDRPGRARCVDPAHDRPGDTADGFQPVDDPRPRPGRVAGRAVGTDQGHALLLEQHAQLIGGGRGGDGLDPRPVTLDGRLEQDRGQRPLLRLGQDLELEGGQRPAVGQLPGRRGRGGGNRRMAQPRQQPLDPKGDRAVAGQRAPLRSGRWPGAGSPPARSSAHSARSSPAAPARSRTPAVARKRSSRPPVARDRTRRRALMINRMIIAAPQVVLGLAGREHPTAAATRALPVGGWPELLPSGVG
jgi:hypothetical protein